MYLEEETVLTILSLMGKVVIRSEVKFTKLCPILCNPMNCIHGILQARILKWVAFPFSRGSSQPRDWGSPTQGDLPNPGIEPRSPALQADSLPAEPPGKPSVIRAYSKNTKAES